MQNTEIKPNFVDYNSETKKTHKDIGTIRLNSTVAILFFKTESCKRIKRLAPECGCTMPINQGDRIMVQFTPQKIVQQTNKGFLVEFEDGTSERLSFSGTVTG